MTQNHDNTVSRKGKHLTYSERCQIAILKKENYSNRQVADVLGCVPQTINNEIKRGTVTQLNRQNQNGKVYDYYHDVYDADAGQAAYEKNRLNCGRRPLWADTDAFIEWADDMMLLEKWSPDVVVGFARKHELFDPAIIPGTTTLYQWIDRGIMKTKNMDLLEKLSRKPKSSRHGNRPNKRVLGKSIEERPEAADTLRGHSEAGREGCRIGQPSGPTAERTGWCVLRPAVQDGYLGQRLGVRGTARCLAGCGKHLLQPPLCFLGARDERKPTQADSPFHPQGQPNRQRERKPNLADSALDERLPAKDFGLCNAA